MSSYQPLASPRTDQRHGTARAISTTNAWLWAVLTLGYLLPWAVAASRGKRNSGGIFWLNLLAGWTIIGWMAALIMAAGTHQQLVPGPVVVINGPGTAGNQGPTAMCASCRQGIRFDEGSGWVHLRTHSIWCDPGMRHQAQPAVG